MTYEQAHLTQEHLFEIEESAKVALDDKLLYALYPDTDGSWRVQAVSIQPSSFICRKALVKAWRGLDSQAIQDKSGIEGCTFGG